MPEVSITIGGRSFSVSCQPGEEHFLRAAAKILDNEVQPLLSQSARMPETWMLLMAGLMIADRTAGQEDELRTLRARVAELETAPNQADAPPVIPAIVTESFAELAARVEAMAAAIEERLPPQDRAAQD